MFVPVLRYIPALRSGDAAATGARHFYSARKDTKLTEVLYYKPWLNKPYCSGYPFCCTNQQNPANHHKKIGAERRTAVTERQTPALRNSKINFLKRRKIC
ncbi:hypothetical protein ASU31_12585 [Pedobacter ginsenosidimutans]|uniref:Uncharacterized protein n=1 Tax=Pedobacter ginsenosidimutans TaxID=687842 RepID=A0A0T5VPT0_9SPHI|nr:hypothetical protein ASU31_12585 [Pedobacter ginsenosidimutans]